MIFILRNLVSRSSYFRDIFWQSLGNASAQLINIFAMVLLARIYTPHDFGILNLFTQTVTILTCIMSLKYEVFIQLPKKNSEAENVLYLVCFFSFLSVLILTPIIWWNSSIISNILGSQYLEPYLIWAPFAAMITCLATGVQSMTQRQGNYKISGFSEIFSKLAYFITALINKFSIDAVSGLLMAFICASFGKLTYLINKKKFNLRLESKIDYRKQFISLYNTTKNYKRFSLSIVYSTLICTITISLPAIFISHMYDKNVLGQYSIVLLTIYLPSSLIGGAIGQVYYQRAAEQWHSKENFLSLWKITSKKLVILGLPLYIFIALLSPWLYPFLLGDKWLETGMYARIMALGGFFSFISTPMDRSCVVVGALWYPPTWQTLRLLAVIIVIAVAWVTNCSIYSFLQILVSQASLMYIIDLFMEFSFSKQKLVTPNNS